MKLTRRAALVYAIVSSVGIAFQIGLAAGMPWGSLAMAGAYPGQLPPALRLPAAVQAVLILGLALVVLARAGLILPGWWKASRRLIWVVVAFSAMSLFLNLITPSASERALWAPVAAVMLVSSLIVARKSPSDFPGHTP